MSAPRRPAPPSMLPDQATLEALADAALGHAQADETQVSVEARADRHVRFARNQISTSGLRLDVVVRVRSSFGQRSATAEANGLDPSRLAELVARSEALARLAPEDPEHMPLLGPQAYIQTPAGPTPTGPTALAGGVGQILEMARSRELVAAGFCMAQSGRSVLKNAAGLSAHHHGGRARLSTTFRTSDGSASGWANSVGHRGNDLDFVGAGTRAADKALAARGAQEMSPADVPVVLEANCVAELAQILWRSLGRRAADEGRSWAAGTDGPRMGERVLDPAVDLWSDAADAQVPRAPFTAEGLPRGRTDWFVGGRLEALETGRFWAGAQGLPVVPGGANLRMSGGKGSAADLVRGMKRGLLITSLWYIRPLDPRTLLHTGLTRDGVYWVEDGKVVRPVGNFRWNDSPLRVLSQIDAMGAPVSVSGRAGRLAGLVVPPIRVPSFRLASTSAAI